MAAAKTLVDAEGFDELERRRDGTFAPGTSGNPGGKKRRDPTALQIQKLAARMTPSVLLQRKRVVDAIDPASPRRPRSRRPR
jgi:hypothetical protein